MKSSKILIFLLFICFVCISCRTEDKQTTFDYSGFKVDKTTNQLCFDLSSDTKVLGAIALKASKNSKNSNTVILPFETQNISYNKKILNTSSSNDNFTIIDYLTSIDKEWLFFLPKYGETESKERGIFLLKEGLKREFIINFDETHPNKELLAQTDTISQITVQLPAKSKTFRTKIEPIFENEDFYEYAIVQILSKPDKTFRLEYMVQATKKQKELIDFLLKLAAIFFIPFAQFFFLEKNQQTLKR